MLIVRVYAAGAKDDCDRKKTTFTLFEDDGMSMSYQNGKYRSVDLHQELDSNNQFTAVTIKAAVGSYPGEVTSRQTLVDYVSDQNGYDVWQVTLNGSPLTKANTEAEFNNGPNKWMIKSDGVVLAKNGDTAVSQDLEFRFYKNLN